MAYPDVGGGYGGAVVVAYGLLGGYPAGAAGYAPVVVEKLVGSSPYTEPLADFLS